MFDTHEVHHTEYIKHKPIILDDSCSVLLFSALYMDPYDKRIVEFEKRATEQLGIPCLVMPKYVDLVAGIKTNAKKKR